MNFITKIFTGKTDASVHNQFVRYSIGEYTPKAVVRIKGSKISTGFEYVNDFLALIGEHTKEDVTVDGKIFLKKEMQTPFSLSKKKGYFTTDIHETIPAKKLKEWVEAYGAEGYFLLCIQSDGVTLKTKTAPHNPKGKYDEAFCKVTVSGVLKDIFLKDILFDSSIGKDVTITHTFQIIDIIIPKEYEHDMALARIHGKRKGKVIRTVVVDGKETKTEKELMV